MRADWLKPLFLAGIVSILAAGCELAGSQDADTAGAAPEAECASDLDCELAAAGCCGCPRFSQPTEWGFGASCEDVACPLPETCAPAAARCESGACVLACLEVSCDLSCEAGFAVDETGCQVCECGAAPAAAQCVSDQDCTRVPADCCGCEQGGSSAAVPLAEADVYVSGLDCGQDPAMCPGVNVCDAAQAPRCAAGLCVLGGAPDGPPMDGGTDDQVPVFCGSAELGECPAGTICVLNDPSAEAFGNPSLGVCQSP